MGNPGRGRHRVRRPLSGPPTGLRLAAGHVTSALNKLLANLSGPERERRGAAFAADPELADGLSTMLANLPPGTQAQIMRRLAARLEHTQLGSGAVRSALTDVIEDTLRQGR